MVRSAFIVGGLFAALLLSAPGAHAREVYRWVDSDGVVHLSDTPPAQARAERLIVRLPKRPSTSPPRASAPVTPARVTGQPVPPSAPSAAYWPVAPAVPAAPVPAAPVPAAPYAQPRSDWRVISVLSAPPVSRNPGLGEAQRRALASRGLDGPRRPTSINSSAHAQRVARSQGLNSVTEAP